MSKTVDGKLLTLQDVCARLDTALGQINLSSMEREIIALHKELQSQLQTFMGESRARIKLGTIGEMPGEVKKNP